MRPHSPTIEDKSLEILGRFISPIVARAVVTRALAKAGIYGKGRAEGDFSGLAALLEDAARLFVDPSQADGLRRALETLGSPNGSSSQSTTEDQSKFPIRVERDISIARTAARDLAERLGAPRYVSQRIATVVSELARNIVNYTPGGVIEIQPRVTKAERSITVRATDQGRGIRNLEEILKGQYVSKTGLGAGIRGARRLADSFEIETAESGTRIVAVFRL